MHINALYDAHALMRDAKGQQARWQAGRALLAACGADWVTLGTAPRRRPEAVAILTCTPASLMRDYLAERIHLDDPWMQHSAASTAPDDLNLDQPTQPPGLPVARRMRGLFRDHSIRHVCLVPSHAGSRPGATVLYATDAGQARLLRTPARRNALLLAVAVVSAYLRPEDHPTDDADSYRVTAPLSPREAEVLAWLASGLETAAIGHRMQIEPVTVGKHLRSARRKLGARTREQALALAVRHGLIEV